MKLAIVHSTGHVWFGVTSLTRLVQISTSPQSSVAMKIKYGALVGQNRLPATQLISRKLSSILPYAPTFFFFSLALLSVFPFLIGCCNWLRCHLCSWVGRCVFPRIYPLPCQHFFTHSSHWLSSIFSFFGFAVMITRSFASAFKWSVRSLWFARTSASNMCLQ